METTPELVIFLIVGAVAIISAVMMLISENAVHSALFLVLNFACVAFFFLMLNAAFLFLVQITVYAGAIMVLFMFVIMLLGAEKVAPETEPRFPWLTPLATVLTTIFLLTAGYGILQSDIESSEPEPFEPMVRVINLAHGAEAVDVYMNGELFAEELTYRESSELTEVVHGDYEVEVVPHGEEAAALDFALVQYVDPVAEMTLTEQINASLAGEDTAPFLSVTEPSVALETNQDITIILTDMEDGSYAIIPVVQNLNTVEQDKQAKVQVVHAVAGAGAIDLADITQPDRRPYLYFEGIEFAQSSAIDTKNDGQSRFAAFETGVIAEAVAGDDNVSAFDIPHIAAVEEDEHVQNSSLLFVVAPPLRPEFSNAPELLIVESENRAKFGGPTGIGHALFTDYMLPFQVIALLLLVAMIGAIVLTRDAVPLPKKRFPRRNAMTGEPSQD